MMQAGCKIIKKEKISAQGFMLVLSCPEIANAASPGQFAHIAVDNKTLRRPISICSFDKDEGTITIVFEVRGEGTEWISQRQAGDSLDILAPLGHGFKLFPEDEEIVVIGGGIGTPPLLSIAQNSDAEKTALLGFRTKDFVILEEDFKAAGCDVQVATDDGSYGFSGYVTQLLKDTLENRKISRVYSCGPFPMLKLISEICAEHSVPCQVSLEERMACGVGACLVCACKTKLGYEHVCKNGPVFNAEDIAWE